MFGRLRERLFGSRPTVVRDADGAVRYIIHSGRLDAASVMRLRLSWTERARLLDEATTGPVLERA